MLQINGSSGTPVIAGFDQFQVSSVTDLGVGNYTVTLNNAFERSLQVVGIAPITAQTAVEVTAVTSSSFTVQCRDLAGVAKDADISLIVAGSDARYDM